MGTILERILVEKQKEIKRLKELKRKEIKKETTYSLIQQLEQANTLSVIAEFKRASPSKGDINVHLNPAEQAKSYSENGAAAISVLTDATFFKGSFEDIRLVREAVDIPILCKDFIIDQIQIDLAKEHGANMILLIATALTPSELSELYQYAKHQNLEVLMEVHDEADLEKAFKVGPKLIGINNRNLKTFEVDLAVTERLAPSIQSFGSYVISESGIFTNMDAKRVSAVGASGVLVGEALMKSGDLTTSLKDLMVPNLKGAKQ